MGLDVAVSFTFPRQALTTSARARIGRVLFCVLQLGNLQALGTVGFAAIRTSSTRVLPRRVGRAQPFLSHARPSPGPGLVAKIGHPRSASQAQQQERRTFGDDRRLVIRFLDIRGRTTMVQDVTIAHGKDVACASVSYVFEPIALRQWGRPLPLAFLGPGTRRPEHQRQSGDPSQHDVCVLAQVKSTLASLIPSGKLAASWKVW